MTQSIEQTLENLVECHTRFGQEIQKLHSHLAELGAAVPETLWLNNIGIEASATQLQNKNEPEVKAMFGMVKLDDTEDAAERLSATVTDPVTEVLPNGLIIRTDFQSREGKAIVAAPKAVIEEVEEEKAIDFSTVRYIDGVWLAGSEDNPETLEMDDPRVQAYMSFQSGVIDEVKPTKKESKLEKAIAFESKGAVPLTAEEEKAAAEFNPADVRRQDYVYDFDGNSGVFSMYTIGTLDNPFVLSEKDPRVVEFNAASSSPLVELFELRMITRSGATSYEVGYAGFNAFVPIGHASPILKAYKAHLMQFAEEKKAEPATDTVDQERIEKEKPTLLVRLQRVLGVWKNEKYIRSFPRFTDDIGLASQELVVNYPTGHYMNSNANGGGSLLINHQDKGNVVSFTFTRNMLANKDELIVIIKAAGGTYYRFDKDTDLSVVEQYADDIVVSLEMFFYHRDNLS